MASPDNGFNVRFGLSIVMRNFVQTDIDIRHSIENVNKVRRSGVVLV